MKIKKDNINHIFRNKYLVGSSGNVISPISSFNDSSKVNEWFYEDENGDLHSKLTLISDKDILATGGITQFIQGDRTESTIMDGVVTDNVTITKENGILKVIGGGGGDFDVSKMWTALSTSTDEQINKSHLTTALSGYATTEQLNSKWTTDNTKIANWDEAYNLKHSHSNKSVLDSISSTKVSNWDTAFSWGNHSTFGYAHLANEETFTGLKHFTEGLSVGSNKKKIYEKDGVVYLDGDLAVTGGITQFASGNVDISTIMDGVVVDGTTIKKENGKLVAIGGGQADSVEWEDILNKPTSFTPSSHTHTKSQISDFPSSLKNPNSLTISLNGTSQGAYDGSAAKSINITASSVGAYTKSESDNKYPLKSGSGASGNWGINITGNAASSSKLQTARTIWGQSFDGTNNVSGNMSNVGLINDSIRIEGGYDNAKIRPNGHGIVFGGGNGYAHCTYAFRPEWGSQSDTQCNVKIQNASAATSNPTYTTTHEFISDGTGYHKTRLRVARTDGEGSGIYTNTIHTSDWFRSEGNTGWYSETYGGGWYMTDNYWIRAYNNKSIITGGGIQTAGNIEINGSGVFTTSNNTILRKKGYTNTDILRWDWNGTDGDHLKFTIPGTNDQSKYMKLSSENGLVVTARIEGNNFNAKSNASTYFSAYNSINEAISGSDPDYKWTWYHAKSGDVQRGFTLWSYSYAGAANQVAAFISYGGNQFKMFGNILATGGITQYSDIRAKNIIEDVNIDLDKIANSPAIRYTWNNLSKCSDSEIHVGGIAQYVKEILPEVIYCTNNDTDLLSMDYATTSYIYSVNIAKYLVAAKNEINELKEQINLLKDTINNNLNTNIK